MSKRGPYKRYFGEDIKIPRQTLHNRKKRLEQLQGINNIINNNNNNNNDNNDLVNNYDLNNIQIQPPNHNSLFMIF